MSKHAHFSYNVKRTRRGRMPQNIRPCSTAWHRQLNSHYPSMICRQERLASLLPFFLLWIYLFILFVGVYKMRQFNVFIKLQCIQYKCAYNRSKIDNPNKSTKQTNEKSIRKQLLRKIDNA